MGKLPQETCMARYGIHKNHSYFPGANKSTMTYLADRVADSDKIIYKMFILHYVTF
jgi:hypothetical protein